MLTRMWRHWNLCALLVGFNMVPLLKKSVWALLKTKVELSSYPAISFMDTHSKESKAVT